MGKSVASRESILEEAKKLAFSKGLGSVNIRRIAMECGISVGAVYNYYPSKADLLLDIAIDFWDAVFRKTIFSLKSYTGFEDYYKQIFHHLDKNMQAFKVNFLAELSTLGFEQKQRAEEAENEYKNALRKRVWAVLNSDSNISPDVWNDNFTRLDFIDFVIDNTLLLLKQGKNDCSFFLAVISKILYK